jgi:hypothetical protein
MENNNSKFVRDFMEELLIEFREWERQWDLYDLNKSKKPASIDMFIDTLIEKNKIS